MLCEIIGGFNPFSSNNIQETFDNIVKMQISWPKNISKQQKSLLNMVMVQDPNLRATLSVIKQDPYFKDVRDWSNLSEMLSEDQQDFLLSRIGDMHESKYTTPIEFSVDKDLVESIFPTRQFETKSASLLNNQHLKLL